jgi:multiple sugar transport system substrate-binding protein
MVVKKIAVALLVGLMSVAFTACTSSWPAAKTFDEPAISGELTIALSTGNYGGSFDPYALSETRAQHHTIKQRLVELMNRYPDLKIVVMDMIDASAYRRLLENPDELPDILELSPDQVRLGFREYLETLDPYIRDRVPARWTGDYAKLIHSANRGGETYILPVQVQTAHVFYDREMFERLHIPLPDANWNWDLFDDAAAVLRANGRPTVINPGIELLENAIVKLGGRYSVNFRFDGVLNSGKTVQAFRRLVDNGYFSEEALRSDDPAMGIGWIWDLRKRMAGNPHMEAVPVPRGDYGATEEPSLITGLGITAKSSVKEEAWRVLEHLVGESDEEAIDLVAHFSLSLNEPRVYTEPDPADEKLLDHLRRAIPNAVPGSVYPLAKVSAIGAIEERVVAEYVRTLMEGGPLEPVLDQMAQQLEHAMGSG